MSEQERKNILSQIKRTLRDDQRSSFQTEHDRLGVNVAPAPERTRVIHGVASDGAGASLGRRVITSKVVHKAPPKVKTLTGLPSVGTHQEHTWSPNPAEESRWIEAAREDESDLQTNEGNWRAHIEDERVHIKASPGAQTRPDGFLASHPPQPMPADYLDPIREELDRSGRVKLSEDNPIMCSFDQAKPGEFCLLFKGNIVAVESSSAKIEAFAESLLRTFENSQAEDIMVFQRRSFRVGAIIE